MSLEQALKDFRAWLKVKREAQDHVYQARLAYQELVLLAEKEQDLVKKANLLAQAQALPFPKKFRIRFRKDWHVLADIKDIDDFVQKTQTAAWNPARRGEAFERWLQIQKSRGLRLKKVRFSANDEFLKELGVELETMVGRDPDRFKVASKSLWDHKHYLGTTNIDEDQLKRYMALANIDGSIDRVCYMFSTKAAAQHNLALMQPVFDKGPLKGVKRKSLQIFFVASREIDPITGETANVIERLAKLK